MSNKRSRTDLTILQKKAICEYKDKNSKATQESIADHFSRQFGTSIARRTIGNILEKKNEWLSVDAHHLKCKRSRKPKFALVEEALATWFGTMQAKKAVVTDAILIGKGKEFADRLDCTDFVPNGGWLSRFKTRNGISLRALHGESASVNVEVVSTARSELKRVLKQYQLCDIYNVDETGLFYRMPPSKSLSKGPRHGTKQFKDRITVELCTNADGSDFIKPMVVGKSANPRCFKDFSADVYVQYEHNNKAWMTRYLFAEWLHRFNRHIKQKKKRPVLLLLDNVATHFPDVQLEYVTLHYLPPNTTSHLQPLDAGIIRSFKALYRSSQVKRLIELLEQDKNPDINLKEAVRYLASAWKSVSPATIRNCWRHTGIVSMDADRRESADSVDELNTLLNASVLSNKECMTASSYLEVDEQLDTGDVPTDEEIVQLVQQDAHPDVENSDDDANDDMSREEYRPPPSTQEALTAARLLQDYFDSKADQEGSWAVIDLQKRINVVAAQSQIQTTLLQYFNF